MVAEKEKAEKEATRLRWELQDLQVGFTAQKKDLEMGYQKQVNDMFFYGYRCCMKKHDIANDTPSFLSDDEQDEFLGDPAPGDMLEPGKEHALGDKPFS